MMERSSGEDPRQETISASELGRYTYCARAWWLERVCGLAPRNLAALQLGTRRHEAHGQVVSTAQHEASLARWLLVLAILLGAALIYSLWLK